MYDNYTETPVDGMPGFTRIKSGGNIQFRDDNTGLIYSNRQFYKLKPQFKSQAFVPRETLNKVAKPFMPSKPAPGVVAASVSPLEQQLQAQQIRTTGQQVVPSSRPPVHPLPEPPADDNQVTEFHMPEPKPDAARGRPSAKSNKATPRELSDGLYITLSIVTAIIAVILSEATLAITDLEAKNIAIPAANLLAKSQLNERFGRLIAESGDWQLLGYALYLYFSRVWEIAQYKFANRQRGPQQPYQQGYQPQPVSQPQSNGHQQQNNPYPGIVLPKPPPGVGGGLN